MKPWDGGQPLLILFLFPIVISAYLGGLGPGILATVLSGVLSNYYLVPPAGQFGFATPVAFAHWVFQLLVGVLVSSVDNFIKPILISGRSPLPTLAVFIGVLGGLTAFGLIGLFLGPVVIALVLALIEFAREKKA